MKNLLTEAIGTFFLVLVIGLSANPIAIGTILMVMVYMGGPVSGAHYNPAVTLAVWMRGRIAPGEAVGYVVAQLVGALLAALTSAWILGMTFAPLPGEEHSTLQALVVEFLFTFALVLVILNVAVSSKSAGNSYFGLAIGFTILAAAFAGGGISGGAFNPAVGIGPHIVHAVAGEPGFDLIWIYLVGPLLGGALAAVVFGIQEEEG